MNNKNIISNNIGETSLITLYFKSIETKKDNPIIVDKTACKLVENIKYDFSKFDKAILSTVGTALRANYFDKKVINYIQQKENPIVILIGCGLDSRVERIGEISKKATFYQLDIPEVMEIREKLIPKGNNEINIHTSMLENEWIEKIKSGHPKGNFIFIIEGVLMYFKEEDVKKVITNLANNFNNGEILFDMPTIWSQKKSHKHDAIKWVQARFLYGMDDDKEMEKWSKKLKYVSTKLYSQFPEWKRTGLKGWIMKIIPKFNKAHRLLHYKINNDC